LQVKRLKGKSYFNGKVLGYKRRKKSFEWKAKKLNTVTNRGRYNNANKKDYPNIQFPKIYSTNEK